MNLLFYNLCKNHFLNLKHIIIALIVSGSSITLIAQTPPARPAKPDSAATKGPKAYSEIITSKAISTKGLFSVHRLDDKYFFEIPDSILGRDIMTITRTSKTPSGAGYGGEQANRQVIIFEKKDDKVFIRVKNYINVSPDSTQEIYKAVVTSNLDPIAAAFDIKAVRKDTSLVVEVTDFFKDANQVFALPPIAKQMYKLTDLQKDRSYIESIRSYPINVEIKTVKTYGVTPPSLNPPTTPQPFEPVTLRGG